MRVRDDDVFLIGHGYDTPEKVVARFKEVHMVIADGGALHVAAILCGTLPQYPTGIEFLKERIEAGELIPEIHGWEHVSYGPLTKQEIVDNLNRCITTINETFDYQPTTFYTPWGSDNAHIREAADTVGLKMVDCSEVVYPKRKFFGGKAWEAYSHNIRQETSELFIHWWEDRWLNLDSHSLVKTLRTVRENRNAFM
jgi:peptidoglycan/xylan/chitin deacetylase (PgdA/CDA1 family)